MISVVIPLYNKAHTIGVTLDTVLKQSYSEFEVVIVNDGSTDNSLEVIRKLTSDIRVRIIDKANEGVSAARNYGVAIAKYEYVAFLDADDEWLPNYLAKMKEAIDLFPDAGMFCSAGIIRNSDGSQNYRVANKYKDRVLEVNFFENPHVFIHTSATVVSKKVFAKTIGFPLNIWDEDFYLFYSIALISKVVYSGYLLSVYVGGVMGQSTSLIYNEDGSYRKDPVPRHNLLIQNWINAGRSNKSFIVFLKYELRHSIKIHLMNKDYHLIRYYFDNLVPEVINNFSWFEKRLYLGSVLRKFAMVYILLTKIRWRMRMYPRIDVVASRF